MKKAKTLYDVLPKRERIYHTAYHRLAHYIYPNGVSSEVKVEHVEPLTFKDKIAYYSIKAIRKTYDLATLYNIKNMTESKWIQRCLILETVAGIPGMAGGMARHLRSLRSLERDKGWIHHLLEEADNERFHLFIFLDIRKPNFIERCLILGAQGVFMNLFFISYLLNPTFSHRFVGYLEEEAVKTYTAMLKDMAEPDSCLKAWNTRRPPNEVMAYYQLHEDATYKDVIECIRADEACHRATNHYLASVDQNIEIPEELVRVINDPQDLKKEKEPEDRYFKSNEPK